MSMKKLRKHQLFKVLKVMSLVLMSSCLVFLSNISISAHSEYDNVPNTSTVESEEELKYDTSSSTITDEKISELLNEDGTVNRKKLNLLVQAFLSSDDEVAKEELKQLYVWGFWQSSSIPIGEEISIWNVFPLLLSLFLLSFVGQLFLILGNIFTFISMLLVKLTSGGVISDIAAMIQDFILDTILFQQTGGTPLGIRIIILIAILSLLAYLISQRHTQITDFLKTFILTVFCAIIVGTLSVNTMKVHDLVNDRITMVTDSIFGVDSTKSKEIEEKSLVFTLLQIQPYLMRNFGVSDSQEIETECNATETGQEQFERLLLNEDDPTGEKKSYAERQTTTCNNGFIKHSDRPLIEIEIFLISLIGGVTTIVLSVPIDIIYLFRMIIIFIVCFRPTVAIYGMLKNLFELNFRGIGTVFMMSVLWMIVGEAAVIIVTTMMQILIKVVATLSTIHPILNLLFGVVMFALALIALKNFKAVMGAITGALKHALALAKDGFTPDSSPFDSMKDNVFEPLAATAGAITGGAVQRVTAFFDKPIKTQEVEDEFEDEKEEVDLENDMYNVDDVAESDTVDNSLETETTHDENSGIEDGTTDNVSNEVSDTTETAIEDHENSIEHNGDKNDENNEHDSSSIETFEDLEAGIMDDEFDFNNNDGLEDKDVRVKTAQEQEEQILKERSNEDDASNNSKNDKIHARVVWGEEVDSLERNHESNESIEDDEFEDFLNEVEGLE